MYLVIYVIAIIVGTNTDVVTTVADSTKQLQQRYISSRFSSSVDEWPPYQPKHYTTLAFIHNKGKFTDAVRFFVAQELAVAGNINSPKLYNYCNLNANMTKKISDIFLPVMTPNGSFVDLHILIEGAPGIGKTVLAKEIAYQWAKNELLTSQKLLLLVFLRECYQKTMMTIEDLIQFIFKSTKMASCVIEYLTKTEGNDTIIILDGFDELSENNRKESIIVDIINRRILTKCCLVVTSRPTASSSLHGSVDRRVEIVGFTEEDRLDYIQTALEDHNEQVEALQHYLQSNPTINALCYIPLNMTILLCLVEDGIDRLPKTQTEMYKRFVEMTIVRFIKKYDKSISIVNIVKLPQPHDELFLELAKLAYEALKTDKIVFTLPEIEKGCPNITMISRNWNGLGLLKAVQCFSAHMGHDQVTFHFLHFSIQEYMAAWYISMLPTRKQVKLLQKTFWEHHYYNTWIMYVGITGGCAFALRHFVSGNWFQLYSKVFGASKVSSKFLKHKMKCLHLFQCLFEADKVDSLRQLDSVNELFQNNQIDLSNQTLLPSDLNTLGFFFIRSNTKKWDELNLSNCNIGSNGSNILCDRFLDKDVRCIVTIKMVNFSYNQLDSSSLMRLIGLFNSWHTSEIIITDDASLGKVTDQKIEDIVLQSSTLVLVHVTSWLFCKNLELSKVRHILSNTTNIESVYLLNCTWTYDAEVLTLLRKQKLSKVRIIGSSNFGLILQNDLIKTLASILLNNNNSVNMFVYSPTMPDQIADDISNLILSSNKDISGVMLIVSSSKVQGIVNTCSLSNELSTLEMFNLSRYIGYLNTEMCPWSLESNSDNKDVIFTFIKLLHKIDFDWKLKVLLWENNTLIVHNAKFKRFDKFKQFTNNNIYLSSCDVNKVQYDVISETCSRTLLKLSIIKCSISEAVITDIIQTFFNKSIEVSIIDVRIIGDDIIRKLLKRRELYLNIKLNFVLSTDHWLCVHNMIKHQLQLIHKYFINQVQLNSCAMAMVEKLEQIDGERMYIFENDHLNMVRVHARTFQATGATEITAALSNSICLSIIDIENYSITHKNTDDLATILCCNPQLQELHLNRNNLHTNSTIKVIKALHSVKTLTKFSLCDNGITDKAANDIAATISCNTGLQVLNINGNDLKTSGAIIISRALQKVSTLTKLYINSNKIACEAAGEIAAAISCNRKLQDVDVSENNLQTKGTIKIMRALQRIHRLNLLHLGGNNITSEAANVIAAVISCNSGLQELNINRSNLKASGAIIVAKTLQKLSGLTKLHIGDNNITSKAADEVATVVCCNTKLEEFDVSGNNLRTEGVIKLATALQNVVTLRKLNISNNNITHEAANSIADVITHNTHLKEFNISRNCLEVMGAIIIAKSLQRISTLRRLYIADCNISDEAADDIAAAVSCNIHLQEFDIGRNHLQASAIANIAKGLQKISTLTKLCINNNSITYEAVDDIVGAISCNTQLEEFDVSGNDLDIVTIAKALQNVVTLTKLNISNNRITCTAANAIAIAITHNTHLQEFIISGNYLKVIGATVIARGLQRISTLTKLYMVNNNISYETVGDIATAISYNMYLQEFDIGRNSLQALGAARIAKGLKKISTLRKLRINNNRINSEVAHDIAVAISCNTQLEEFDVSGNNLETEGVIKIAVALQSVVTLTKLNISSNHITCKAANAIAVAITHNTHLQEFIISGNYLKVTGAVVIARGLQNISTLTKLYIANNNISDGAADDIAAALSCNAIQVLDVSDNYLGTTGITKLAKALQNIFTLTNLYISNNKITDDAINAIAAAISCNPYLEEFDIGKNLLQRRSVIKLAKSFQQISTLKKVIMDYNKITDEEASDDIAAVISHNPHLKTFRINGNNIFLL